MCSGAPSASWPGRSRWSRRWETWRPRAATTWRRRRTRSSRRRATLTGSIGVVGGKPNLEGLYRRIGVARDAVERGARAGLLSEARGFTPDERAALREDMASLYGTFVARVAEGRGLSTQAVERVAQGRIWSGARAQALGLVDAIGGPLEALRETRRRAGLREGERALIELHPRTSALAGLRWLRQLISVRLGGV
ncbi:MAG: S49 family peptidase [Candidatus Limnocylindria bacterium]